LVRRPANGRYGKSSRPRSLPAYSRRPIRRPGHALLPRTPIIGSKTRFLVVVDCWLNAKSYRHICAPPRGCGGRSPSRCQRSSPRDLRETDRRPRLSTPSESRSLHLRPMTTTPPSRLLLPLSRRSSPRPTSRKRARLLQAAEPLPDDPEADAAMRAWLERAKWGRGPG